MNFAVKISNALDTFHCLRFNKSVWHLGYKLKHYLTHLSLVLQLQVSIYFLESKEFFIVHQQKNLICTKRVFNIPCYTLLQHDILLPQTHNHAFASEQKKDVMFLDN